MGYIRRRQFLQTTTVVLGAGLAGCTGDGDDSDGVGGGEEIVLEYEIGDPTSHEDVLEYEIGDPTSHEDVLEYEIGDPTSHEDVLEYEIGDPTSHEDVLEYEIGDPTSHEDVPEAIIEHPTPEEFVWIGVEFELLEDELDAGELLGLTQIRADGSEDFSRGVRVGEEILTSSDDEHLMAAEETGEVYYRLEDQPEDVEWIVDQLQRQHESLEVRSV